jgi:uncharacterized protein (TIGR02145 family)
MKALFTFLISAISIVIFAQAPQSIPYQAVVRNTDGTMMANAAVTITFKIHDNSASGTVVYEETHAATTNAQGLVSLNVGGGTAMTGTFSGIHWGTGSKFLQVLINAGNGVVDLGTQQMMSVPYTLYAENTVVRISNSGDTLTIGGNSVIVPGISLANPVSTSNYGSVLLPGNTTCQNEYISVTGCGGQDSLLYYDRYYSLVEIGGQCWFAENLATDKYANGDNIPTGLDNTQWQNTTAGAFAVYNDDMANDAIYGKLYNWYTTVDSRGVCPTGWHVPSDCEWNYLEEILTPGSSFYFEPDECTMTSMLPNIHFNGGGLNLVLGGHYISSFIGEAGFLWSTNDLSAVSFTLADQAWFRSYHNIGFFFDRCYVYKTLGFSIRCIKD